MAFEKVLIPLKLNESRRRMSALAAAVAGFGARSAVLLHVVSAESAAADRGGSDLLEQRCAVFSEHGLRVQHRTVWYSDAGIVTRVAREIGADCIAASWKPKNWIQRSLSGSIIMDAIRTTDVPVFVHKQPLPASWTDPKGPILYATAFDIVDRFALPLLNNNDFGPGHVIILHSATRAPDARSETERSEQAEVSLGRLAARCLNRNVTTLSLTGSPERVIPRQARLAGARMIVVGKSASVHNGPQQIGRTAEAIVHARSVSVFVLPADAPVLHAADNWEPEEHRS
ncbi:MAG: universal stress protein [Spirochaetaceae bacterium]